MTDKTKHIVKTDCKAKVLIPSFSCGGALKNEGEEIVTGNRNYKTTGPDIGLFCQLRRENKAARSTVFFLV